MTGCAISAFIALAVAAAPAPAPAEAPAMSVGEAVVLGVVEGLTEYLPVSSTGHLILAQRAMGIGLDDPDAAEGEPSSVDTANAFAICIQGGAILAVLGLYWRRVLQMMRGLAGRDPQGRRLLVNLFAGVTPAVVIGLAFEDQVKSLFGLWPIVAAWFVGGLAILAVGWWRRRRRGADESQGQGEHAGLALEDLSWPRALAVGLMQCVAMWPGVSRSLMTMVGGVIVGMRLPAAVEFSFLLGVVTLGGATLKDGVEHGPAMLELYGPGALAAGFLAAFVSAVAAIKWMVAYLQKHPLDVFGYYRIAMAAVVALLLWRGAIAP